MQPGNDLKLRAHVKLRLDQKRAEERYAKHPWPFLCECVYTLDQVRGGFLGGTSDSGRILPLVAEDEKEDSYLRELTEEWMTEPLLALPKSRRMRVSWWSIAVHYWLARYHAGSKIAFAARKAGNDDSEGSAELVKRAYFIHEHVPKFCKPRPVEYKTGRLQFLDSRSEIVGIGQGADQLRQHTCTAILGDEVAFWTEARDFYTASKPTTEGGGRVTLVSSAYPGFFENLVYDRIA